MSLKLNTKEEREKKNRNFIWLKCWFCLYCFFGVKIKEKRTKQKNIASSSLFKEEIKYLVLII